MTSLFADLSEADLLDAKSLSLPSGAVAFHPGSQCPGFIAVKQGSIRVSHLSPGGREVTLYRVGPGQLCLQTFTCLTRAETYSATGIVEEPLDAQLISAARFEILMTERALFRESVFRAVGDRFADFQDALETLAFTGLPARIAGALLRLARNGAVAATHETIAAEIGSAREAVSRQIGIFAKSGLVRAARGHIELIEPRKLAALRDA